MSDTLEPSASPAVVGPQDLPTFAGEFRMSLLHVSTGDLVEGVAGAGATNVTEVFDVARAARPCVLFLDEFDSIAQRRGAAGHPEERRTVNQLLVVLEAVQDDPDVFVVAATNDLDHLDPAVLRPGRFDRQVRVDLPDHEAMRAFRDAAASGEVVHVGPTHLDAALEVLAEDVARAILEVRR